MSDIEFFLTFKGRASRGHYWRVMLVLNMLVFFPAVSLGIGSERASSFVDIACLVLLWPALAVQVKRWHDRDKAAWWMLINLVPLLGFIWSLIENGFLEGTHGPNRYGPDPMEMKNA